MVKKLAAEFLGTFILVFFAVGTAVFGIAPRLMGDLGVALAFGFAGLAIGIVLVVCHLVGIPLDGTSVNPARSIGPALFEGETALSQLWLFIVAPLVGGGIAAGVNLVLHVEETPLREELRQRA